MRKTQKEYQQTYIKKWGKKQRSFQSRKSKYKHKISYQDYLELEKKQNNLCAICQKPEKNKCLAIDHNHITDNVRGLLCQKCNRALGGFKDDVELLKNAVAYLLK